MAVNITAQLSLPPAKARAKEKVRVEAGVIAPLRVNGMAETEVPPLREDSACVSFFKEGNCWKGDDCTFSHDPDAKPEGGGKSKGKGKGKSKSPAATRPCKFFARGTFTFGDECIFSHNPNVAAPAKAEEDVQSDAGSVGAGKRRRSKSKNRKQAIASPAVMLMAAVATGLTSSIAAAASDAHTLMQTCNNSVPVDLKVVEPRGKSEFHVEFRADDCLADITNIHS